MVPWRALGDEFRIGPRPKLREQLGPLKPDPKARVEVLTLDPPPRQRPPEPPVGTPIGAPHRQLRLQDLVAASKTVKVTAPGASKKTLAEVDAKASAVIARLEQWTAEPWGFPSRNGAQAEKIREQLGWLLSDVRSAAGLLKARPTQRAVLKLDHLLAQVRQLSPTMQAYLALRPGPMVTGRPATAEELAERKLAAEREAELRPGLKNAIGEVAEQLYVVLSDLSGVKQSGQGTSSGAFREDPLTVIADFRTRIEAHDVQNFAFAELEVGGQSQRIGPLGSGRGSAALPRTFAYAKEARSLLQRPGQGGFPRSNDTEVQILEAAKAMLEQNPQASGTLRIFTEQPCCKSCLRVMSKFRAEHPNIKVEVYSDRGTTE